MRLFRKAEKPEAQKLATFYLPVTQAHGMAHRYDAFAGEGYALNPVAYACIDKIATALTSVDLKLYQRNRDGSTVLVESHPVLDLLERPNPFQSGRDLFDALIRYKLIGGNAYLLNVSGLTSKQPVALQALCPAHVQPVPSDKAGIPLAYEYRESGGNGAQRVVTYPVDIVRGTSSILHIKTFSPMGGLLGLPPLQAAAYAADIFNAGQKWNFSLLKNEARPSGAMQLKSKDGQPATLTDDQFRRLREQIDAQFSGMNNAGRPMLLEGGLEWVQMGFNARDMDFEKSILNNGRFIASVYGVPPMLINIPGESTFSNFEQARLALWTDTVIPQLCGLLDSLNRWLVPMYGDNLYLWYDEDMIPALEPLRKEKGERINAADYLSIDEKREAMGYAQLEGGLGDSVFVPASNIPLELAGDPGLAELGSAANAAG
jgi:HK97 family phage portal protein